MSSKYETPIDLSNSNDCHTMMVELIGGNKRVLETGCSSGYMSRVLVERGCTVVGVDINPDAAAAAKEVCEDVIVGDLETLDLASLLEPNSFDVVVFGDVLEHLRDPLATLRGVRTVLAPNGYIVASIPNVAHGAVRLSLLQGRFEYSSLGLLDQTHVRFFTKDGIEALFKEAGFAVVEMRRTTADIFQTEIPLERSDFDTTLVEQLAADPEAVTYQFVCKAVYDDAAAGVHELHEREEQQRVENMRMKREITELREQLAALAGLPEQVEVARQGAAILNAERERLSQEIDRRQAALEEARAEIRAHVERWQRIERRWPVRAYRFLRRKPSG